MATRSIIGKREPNGTITAIYCHYDGYPENNGQLLIDYWNDSAKIDQLMKLGDLSALGKEIGKKQDFDNPNDESWCLAYGRDRGEKNTKARSLVNEDEFVDFAKGCGTDFSYLWQDGYWLCWNYTGLVIDIYNLKAEV